MVEELIAVIAAYGIGVGLVHWLRRRSREGREGTKHAVIVTRDAGSIVEWHLRALAFGQWLKSRYTKITLIDEGSSDDTLRIAERLLGKLHAEWELISAATPSEAQSRLARIGAVHEIVVIRGALAGGAGSAV
ncbi:hypothetical protein [Paenibacillus sp.]|uniref:hypothetical protein n=1 Tax=Paenibacillus sp. TaxID=58172 RepID=UPI002D5360BC|nr:hypothetical protein [Paenibacillus sp.]HZG87381.1 hypothetical protein [Paenibacillus sp.]